MASDSSKSKWVKHKGVEKLKEELNLMDTCGYITFINTGVPDIGCEEYELDVHLIKPKSRNAVTKERQNSSQLVNVSPSIDFAVSKNQ